MTFFLPACNRAEKDPGKSSNKQTLSNISRAYIKLQGIFVTPFGVARLLERRSLEQLNLNAKISNSRAMNCSLPLRAQAGRLAPLPGVKFTIDLPYLQPALSNRSNIRSRALAGGNNGTSSSEVPEPSQPQTRIIGSTLSSTRPRIEPEIETSPQHFGGALTTLVLGASLLSERLNGVGIVQNLELHNHGFHPVLLASVFMLLCAAAWPEKRERNDAGLNPSVVVRVQMAGARIAYLGLAGAIAAEMFTGKGILTLLDFETGVEILSDVEAGLAFIVMLLLTGPQSRSK